MSMHPASLASPLHPRVLQATRSTAAKRPLLSCSSLLLGSLESWRKADPEAKTGSHTTSCTEICGTRSCFSAHGSFGSALHKTSWGKHAPRLRLAELAAGRLDRIAAAEALMRGLEAAVEVQDLGLRRQGRQLRMQNPQLGPQQN